MRLETEQLIQAACAGDKEALSKLLTVCQPDIKRFARRTCSTSEDVEDAVQIALWQLHSKIGTLKTIATFSSWLFRIVERECYRLFRKNQPVQSYDESNLEHTVASSTDLDLRIDLTNLIISLPLTYREVFIMRDVEEFTAPEVAERLGITIEAVKSRLHRARAMVREELNTQGHRDNKSH